MSRERGRALVLGGSHSEVPLVEAAQAMGWEVFTSGNDANGQAHPRADGYLPSDYSSPEQVSAVVAKHGVSGIIAGCNDFAAVTASVVAEQYGLGGHDDPLTTYRLHHKDQFRRMMAEFDLPRIEARRVGSIAEALEATGHLSSPLIVKPVDLTGGKGISVCHTESDLRVAIAMAQSLSRVPHVIVEEYISGSQHGFSCFIVDQKVTWWFADDELYSHNPFLVAGTLSPSSLSTEFVADLVATVNVIAQRMKLVDGLVHIQCVATGEGPRIIELCRRCPGDLYPYFVRQSTAFDYAKAIVQFELGGLPFLPARQGVQRPVVRHCAMPDSNGRYVKTCVSESVSSHVVGRWPLLDSGHEIDNYLSQKSEIIFMQFATEGDLYEHLRRRVNDVTVAVDTQGELTS